MKRLLLLLLPVLVLVGCGGGSPTRRAAVAADPCPVPARMGCAAQQAFPLSVGQGSFAAGAAQGLDISNYQGFPDLARAKAAGLRFLIGQSNDGAGFRDYNFVRNWQRARQLGIPHGAYLFARPGCALCQAAVLASQVRRAGGLDAGALPPTIDAEVPGAYCNVPAIAAALRADLRIKVVLTYTSPGLWGCGPNNGGTLLFAAIWGSAGFSFAGWHGFVVQQFCGVHCHFPGVSGEVDRDVDHGLLALIHSAPTHAQLVAQLRRDYRARAKLRGYLAYHNCRPARRPRPRPKPHTHEQKRKCAVVKGRGDSVNADIVRLHRKGIR